MFVEIIQIFMKSFWKHTEGLIGSGFLWEPEGIVHYTANEKMYKNISVPTSLLTLRFITLCCRHLI